MIRLAAILATSAVLSSPGLAFADTLVDYGFLTYNTASISFLSPTSGSLVDSGIFSNLSGGSITYAKAPISYTLAGTYAPTEIFSASSQNGASTIYFDATSDTVGAASTFCIIWACPTATFNGYFTGSGLTGDIPATLNLLAEGTSNGTSPVFFLADVETAVTPEPSSFLLAGTGILGALALLFARKRRMDPPLSLTPAA